jgi:hypothetical protein
MTRRYNRLLECVSAKRDSIARAWHAWDRSDVFERFAEHARLVLVFAHRVLKAHALRSPAARRQDPSVADADLRVGSRHVAAF